MHDCHVFAGTGGPLGAAKCAKTVFLYLNREVNFVNREISDCAWIDGALSTTRRKPLQVPLVQLRLLSDGSDNKNLTLQSGITPPEAPFRSLLLEAEILLVKHPGLAGPIGPRENLGRCHTA